MSNDATNEEINERMHRAVQEAATDLWPGDIVTRAVVIAEVLDGDTGERTAVAGTTPGMKVWDVSGLLQFGIMLDQAKMTAGYIGGEE